MRQDRSPQPGGQHWPVLAWLSLVFPYLALVGMTLWARGPIGLTSDYYSFRASAEIAWSQGFASVYDMDCQAKFQHALYDAYATGPHPMGYATAPVPYLPVWVLFLGVLLIFPPIPGAIFWTVLNAAVLLLYLRRFLRAIGGPAEPLWPLFLAYPTFLTLFYGQVNVWLLVALGEFLLALRRRGDFAAGLWLVGLTIKPTMLLLIVPGLALNRRFKVLGGLALATVVVGLASLALAGGPGLVALGRLMFVYGSRAAVDPTSPQAMMNWRALAINLQPLLPAGLAWGPAIVGLVVTTASALWPWPRTKLADDRRLGLLLLAICAATCAVTWHAHVHTALPTLIPLLFLKASGRLPHGMLIAWGVTPAWVYLLTLPLLPDLAPNLAGLAMLGLNLGLVAWALRARPLDESPEMATMAGMRNSTDKEP